MLLSIVVPSAIEYMGGTVNGEQRIFEQSAGVWVAEAEQSDNDLYVIDLELTDAAGNRSRHTETIYYRLPGFVYDRTQEDVDNKRPKACLNARDLERTESNTELIADYIGVPVRIRKDWKAGDLPRRSDYLRIRDNVEKIRSGYAIRADTPETPEQPLNTYQKWNDIEHILHDVFWIYMNNKNNIEYCGELSAGEEIGVI